MDKVRDVDRYVDAWTRTQLEIWREKIERMHIVRSGSLHESFRQSVSSVAQGTTIVMKFLEYGIYQAAGTGRGYVRDNGGDLPFLDASYRSEHRLDIPRKVGPAWGGYMTSGKPRERRDWFSKKLYMSVMAMTEDMARILGENAAHIVCDNLENAHSALTR